MKICFGNHVLFKIVKVLLKELEKCANFVFASFRLIKFSLGIVIEIGWIAREIGNFLQI